MDLNKGYKIVTYPAARKVPSLQIVWQRYSEIHQSLFNVLFFVYRSALLDL